MTDPTDGLDTVDCSDVLIANHDLESSCTYTPPGEPERVPQLCDLPKSLAFAEYAQ